MPAVHTPSLGAANPFDMMLVSHPLTFQVWSPVTFQLGVFCWNILSGYSRLSRTILRRWDTICAIPLLKGSPILCQTYGLANAHRVRLWMLAASHPRAHKECTHAPEKSTCMKFGLYTTQAGICGCNTYSMYIYIHILLHMYTYIHTHIQLSSSETPIHGSYVQP